MPNRSRMPADTNQLAASVVSQATSTAKPKTRTRRKNAAAVALGRLGGKKGGRARAAKLSQKRRSQIASSAANARWKKPESGP